MSLPDDDETVDQVEKATESIQRLRSRTSAVTETTLDRLEKTDRIRLGEFEVLVDIWIVCNDCGAHVTVNDLLTTGGCECE